MQLVIVGSKLFYYLKQLNLCQMQSVEITSVMTFAENYSVPCCICYCKTRGVDTVYLPLLPKPPIQTWQAALFLRTHPHVVSIRQSYSDTTSVLDVCLGA